MDSGVDTTQRLVITLAVFLGLAIVLVIGYSLYTKAKIAEGELAKKEALDQQTKTTTSDASISLTGEAKNASKTTYDGLIQKGTDSNSSTTDFQIVNETATVTVPEETDVATPTEEAVPPEDNTPPATPAPVVKKPVVTNTDRPLTAAEIQAIRQLPIDNSPSGNLQTSLEEQSNGQYKARY